MGQEETMNQQQHDKENYGRSGSNTQGGETEPKSKRIKLDDPNIQPIKRNQVDDEEAISDSVTHEPPLSDPNTFEGSYEWSAYECGRSKLLEKLAKRGVDITIFDQADYKGQCDFCGDVDRHPSDDCPWADFLNTTHDLQ